MQIALTAVAGGGRLCKNVRDVIRRTPVDALTAAGVDFVVVGGVGLVLRGSSRVTLDLVTNHRLAE